MNSTYSDVRQDVLSDVAAYTGGHHTAQSIAEAYNVSDSTIRNRWFPWLKKVAPESLLKSGKGYTDLARTLFCEFAEVKHSERDAWVTDAKARYSHEWASAGVIEGELMPDSVSSALALRQTQNGMMQQSIAEELADLESFVDQLAVTEADFSDAELASFQAAGQRRGMMRYKLELQAEMDTYGQLKQRRMGSGQ
ncbi:hypothetical protein [Leptothoe spongobia]|uniref:Uncharacterized protein n=1 Tax=Leptothoe spongobia TAU-MAC 1115 TaxID=1967444 RepID=A0A947DJE4_9CYAN|nr:hypothetical protein [Leptothoe spongobia]MBT9317733.1 hypothetical protein [Leptothoe spongobia TAU-MAC 1115]